MSLHKELRAFAAEHINQPGEHKKAEIAAAFLDEHADLAAEYMRVLAEKQIAGLIKELCDESKQDPLPIFAGLPAAIAIAPGVVKATANCLLADLSAGLEYRRQNLARAADRYDQYGQAMKAYESLRASEEETVGECEARLRLQGPITGEVPS